MSTPSTTARPHLVALLLSLSLAGVVLASAWLFAGKMEHRHLHAVAPLSLPIKDQGSCLARQLAQDPHVLPLYGSSELVKNIRDKASQRFRCYPTDFAVSPIGKAGTTSLMIAQKLAAIGPDVRGRKIAITLSPGWFYSVQLDPHHYAGNFSPLHTSEVAFTAPLSPELRKELAARILDYPEPLDRVPLASFALERLSGSSWADQLQYELCRPLGVLEVCLMRLEDHAFTAFYLWRNRSQIRSHPPRSVSIDWQREFAKWTARAPASPMSSLELHRWRARWQNDQDFLTCLSISQEWHDFDLLLRTMKELEIDPLLVSMPFDGNSFDEIGISESARQVYYSRLSAAAARYGFTVINFSEHDHDQRFLVDRHDHLSVEGWAYVDAALDDFFHDRLRVKSPAHREQRIKKG